MSIGVAGQKHGLKEHHARVPHGRRTAQQRQEQFGRHWLRQKQQPGAQENRERKHSAHRLCQVSVCFISSGGGLYGPFAAGEKQI
jgi:hypothetical protein